MFVLIDEQSNKVKFSGTEAECLDFSIKNPNCCYVMVNTSKEEQKEKEE